MEGCGSACVRLKVGWILILVWWFVCVGRWRACVQVDSNSFVWENFIFCGNFFLSGFELCLLSLGLMRGVGLLFRKVSERRLN